MELNGNFAAASSNKPHAGLFYVTFKNQQKCKSLSIYKKEIYQFLWDIHLNSLTANIFILNRNFSAPPHPIFIYFVAFLLTLLSQI